MKKIQKKYRGKKDQASIAKQNEEIQALYASYGVSPSGSCLQLIIQTPILFALYRIMYNIPAYIQSMKQLFINIIEPMRQVDGFASKFYEVQQAANIKSNGMIDLVEKGQIPTVDQMVDAMNKFNPDAWKQLQDSFSSSPEVVAAITENATKIQHFNEFLFGINLTEIPWSVGIFSVYILIPIASALFSFLSSYSMMSKNTNVDKNDPTYKMTKSMMIYMPFMSGFIALTVPAGLGLYWAAGSLVMWIQQILVNKYLDRMDIDEFIAKNREKAEQKAASGKKSFMQKMAEMDARNAGVPSEEEKKQRSISEIASISTKKIIDKTENSTSHIEGENKGSISQKANIMLHYDEKKDGK